MRPDLGPVRLVAQKFGQARAQGRPDLRSRRHYRIPRRVGEQRRVKPVIDPAQIKDHLADRHAHARATAIVEDAAGQVLDREIRPFRIGAFDPGPKQTHRPSFISPEIPRGCAGGAPAPLTSRPACRRTSSRGSPSSRCNRPAGAPPSRRIRSGAAESGSRT